MLYILFANNLCFYQVKMLMSYDVQITDSTIHLLAKGEIYTWN